MSKVVWKSILAAADEQELSVPADAEFLFVHEQFDEICVWYRCDPNQPCHSRKIFVCGTGHAAPSGRYLGSAVLRDGKFIFHVFEQAQS